MIREPVAAGSFYPASKESLVTQIESMMDKTASKRSVLGVIAPHAGYVYSGSIACETFSSVVITDSVIMLGPNHTGLGQVFSIDNSGKWRTPMGDIGIDHQLSSSICAGTNLVKQDKSAHAHEHSIEVQLPIMQYIKSDFKIAAISLSNASLAMCRELAEAIASAVKKSGKDILIVASSDMTHYESRESAEKKDNIAIESILNLDQESLYAVVRDHDISMCGYIPAIVMLHAVKILGAQSAKLIRYATSGDTTGDYSSVVGYAGICIK